MEGSHTPRNKRHLPLWVPVHVVNRGIDKRQLFFQAADYEEFMVLLVEAVSRFAVDVFGYNVMPNHFHLLLRQRSEGAISAALRRVSGGSAYHYRRTTSTVGLGHVYQRRFWSHVISDEQHYVTGLRYVEDNARQGGLVGRAEDWQWGSLWERVTGGRRVLAPSLVQLPENWVELVNQGLSEADLKPFRSPTLARQVVHSPAGCPSSLPVLTGGPVPAGSRMGTCPG
jgi:putative transposase